MYAEKIIKNVQEVPSFYENIKVNIKQIENDVKNCGGWESRKKFCELLLHYRIL